MMVDNPGFGLATGFQPKVKRFLLVAKDGRHFNTGRKLRATGVAHDKVAFG